MSDDLRERIAKVLYYRSMHFVVTERVWEEEKDAIYAFRDDAQAIIDDLELIVDGARWQREALLSDEAVERAARALCAAAGGNPDSSELWDEEPPWLYYTDEARAVLTAALGEDER